MVRFDKPCQSVHGATSYFSEHMAKSDYLTEGGSVEMVWYGEGAERLGLSGVVDARHFQSLCKGRDPFTEAKLMQRDDGEGRRVCYFGQISAPKDVSIALYVGGDERITRWWEEAVNETLREIELTTLTRVRRGGAKFDRETGNMIAAVVTHDASRDLDPQLHTHVCIMNLTFDTTEDRWKGVQPSGYFKHQGYFREVCYNKLATRMLAAGYELERARSIGFTIKGFPEELRKRFSKRREKILEWAHAMKKESQDDLQYIAGKSRNRKTAVEAGQLRDKWKVEAGNELPVVQETVAQANDVAKPRLHVSSAQAIAYAEEHVFERRSVVNERVLLREALIHGRGQVTLESLQRAVGARIKTGELIRNGPKVTSKKTLELEQEMIRLVNEDRKVFRRWGEVSGIDPALSGEQQQVMRAVFESRDRMMIIEGNAGTGKTRTLKEIVSGMERYSNAIFACAPSSGAAEILRQEVTSAADTLQQLLVNWQLQQEIRGRTILVDEASLISMRQMRDLFRLARDNNNRLLLVGDTKQHSSIEAGDALRALHQYARVEVASLRTIRRQKDPGFRKAVELFAQRQPRLAFEQFDKMGAIHEIKNPDLLYKQAAQDYVQTLQEGKSCLAVSPVWEEIHQFTDVVRAELKEKNALGKDVCSVTAFTSYQWTKAECSDVTNYQVGDVLEFHRKSSVFEKGEMVRCVGKELKGLVVERTNGERCAFNPKQITGYDVGCDVLLNLAIGEKLLLRGNLKASRLQNGEIVEVAGFGENRVIQLQDGRALPGDFRRFAYGYATTSHAAQGKTVDRGILILTDEGMKAANLKQAYVSNSRFRESQAIYVTSKTEAHEAMAASADRELAMELLAKSPLVEKLGGRLTHANEAKYRHEAEKMHNSVTRKQGIRPKFIL